MCDLASQTNWATQAHPIHIIPRPMALDLDLEEVQQPIAVDADVLSILHAGGVAAFGVSGGKDGTSAALAGVQYLDAIGHTGPRVLVHADLGRVEWTDSLPQCQRLAEHLGLELIVVRREAGDMMDRWLSRWQSNVQRFRQMETVKLILPWSTAQWRFCTGELKNAVIVRELKKRFPAHEILNITGVRRQESARRRVMPVSKANDKLTRKGLRGRNWNPIIEWPVEQVFETISKAGDGLLHEAYSRYRVERVSCVYCVMAKEEDLKAAAECLNNHDIYREMVDLEIASTFSFQDARWLGDMAPHLLTQLQLDQLQVAKERATRRKLLEVGIPDHLLFDKDGYPRVIPTVAEAQLLCDIRRGVAELIGTTLLCDDVEQIIERYTSLMREKAAKTAAVTQ